MIVDTHRGTIKRKPGQNEKGCVFVMSFQTSIVELTLYTGRIHEVPLTRQMTLTNLPGHITDPTQLEGKEVPNELGHTITHTLEITPDTL